MGPTDCPTCASERAQSRAMAESLNDFVAALRGVRAYADECMHRAGAMIDAATVAASLAPFLSGRVLPVDSAISVRVGLLEDALSRDEHIALVRHHAAKLIEMLRERGGA